MPKTRDAARRSQWARRGVKITDAEYDALLAAQDGVCAVCSHPPKTRRLHVDHDHKTGRIRGLLCYRCNIVLRPYVTLPLVLKIALYLGPQTDDYRAAMAYVWTYADDDTAWQTRKRQVKR